MEEFDTTEVLTFLLKLKEWDIWCVTDLFWTLCDEGYSEEDAFDMIQDYTVDIPNMDWF